MMFQFVITSEGTNVYKRVHYINGGFCRLLQKGDLNKNMCCGLNDLLWSE